MIARDDWYCFLLQCHLPNLVSSVRPAALWPAQLIKSPAQQTTARMDALWHKLVLSRWSSAHPRQGLATIISFYYVCFPSKRSLICSGGKSTRKRLLSYSHTQSQTLERRRLSPKSLKRALNPALCVASVNADIPKRCQVYRARYGRPRTLLQAQRTHKAWLFVRITLLSTNPWL